MSGCHSHGLRGQLTDGPSRGGGGGAGQPTEPRRFSLGPLQPSTPNSHHPAPAPPTLHRRCPGDAMRKCNRVFLLLKRCPVTLEPSSLGPAW